MRGRLVLATLAVALIASAGLQADSCDYTQPANLAASVIAELDRIKPSDRASSPSPWTLRSSFLMSLHARLMDAAMAAPAAAAPAGLTAGEWQAWTGAVAAYRAAGGKGDMSFAAPMMTTTDELSQVGDLAADPPLSAPMHDALLAAAPIYRSHWWRDDDLANRFFMSYASALVAEAGPALIERHEKVYGAAWPSRISLFATPVAGPFGAYTFTGRKAGVITTMASREPDYQGLRVLEMFLHESSHAVVFPNQGRVADAIAASSKKRGIDPPRNLWHAILFATSGEIARQYLADHGTADYKAASADMLTRVWPQFRQPIETFWLPYVDGRGTLEDAIDKIVGRLAGGR